MTSIGIGITLYGLFTLVLGLIIGYKCGKGEKLW